MHKVSALVLLLCAFAPVSVSAHAGGLNAEGCHNNRKTGDYHCHRAPVVAPQTTIKSTAQESAKVIAQQDKPAAQRQGAPVCYVGPRGGTYTMTPSGRKNYSGC